MLKPFGIGSNESDVNTQVNQRATIGWKAIKVSEILVEPYMVRIESLSAYSDTAEAN